MKFGEKIVEGIFLERPNRYLARVEVDGKEALAHVPDPGRLQGLLLANRKVRLIHQPSENVKQTTRLPWFGMVQSGYRYFLYSQTLLFLMH